MVFNSLTFIFFLAVVLALHYAPLPWRVKKLNLLVASYLFYAAWNPPFVILLWISTVADWMLAKRIHRSRTSANRRLLLCGSLAVNLGLLAFFKYGTFLLDGFVFLVQQLGVDFTPARPDIVLPIGISFYTFQTLSYTLDIYRGRLRPAGSFLDYALFVSFFPQLVAGPIVRAVEFLPQCLQPRRATASAFAWGLCLLLLGLFQKVVLADGIFAPESDVLYNAAGRPGALAAWTGTLAFAGQIFCDFAGYSTCAIGVAMCLGFSLPDNFRFPYAAIGFSDFWRRWHISLSSWLRDYLYFSLGGNRKGELRAYVNVSMTMLIGGLWHGASWTFVFWGGLHGAYLAVERLVRAGPVARWRVWGHPILRLGLALGTFALVCLAWVFFRAGTFLQAFTIAGAMLGIDVGTPALDVGSPTPEVRAYALPMVGLAMAVILWLHWRLRDQSLEAVAARLPWWVRSLMLAAMLVAMLVAIRISSGEERAFIYFQF